MLSDKILNTFIAKIWAFADIAIPKSSISQHYTHYLSAIEEDHSSLI